MTDAVKVTPWPDNDPPSRDQLWLSMTDEGLSPYAWSNGPMDVYAAHTHSFNKVIYVVSGSITFGLPDFQRNVTLFPGDRLDLPRGIVHDALVGKDGVVCLEGHYWNSGPLHWGVYVGAGIVVISLIAFQAGMERRRK